MSFCFLQAVSILQALKEKWEAQLVAQSCCLSFRAGLAGAVVRKVSTLFIVAGSQALGGIWRNESRDACRLSHCFWLHPCFAPSVHSLAALAMIGILDSSCEKHVCYTGFVPCVDAYLRPGCLQRDIIHTPDIIMDDEVESTTRLSSVEMYKLTRLQIVCCKPGELFLHVSKTQGVISVRFEFSLLDKT